MKIFYTSKFLRNLKKLPKNLKEIVRTRSDIFMKDPFDPRLRTHQLKGKMKPYYSFSITYSHRIVFDFQNSDEVVFIDIGDHDIYW